MIDENLIKLDRKKRYIYIYIYTIYNSENLIISKKYQYELRTIEAEFSKSRSQLQRKGIKIKNKNHLLRINETTIYKTNLQIYKI